MDKEAKIVAFDPNEPALNTHLFGLPFDADECDVHVFPAPWEVTVSYGAGTAEGPAEIEVASAQVDLFDEQFPNGWQRGIWMHPIDEAWAETSANLREKASQYLTAYEQDDVSDLELRLLDEINDKCGHFHRWVEKNVSQLLAKDRSVILLGGDHSTSLGSLRAHKAKYGSFGILQIDAHADLRNAYEGFTYSHASIMYNALSEHLADQLCIVGLRDYCHAEAAMIEEDPRITVHTDRAMNEQLFGGSNWAEVTSKIVATLPQHVYLSVDIDGLDPALCPGTGTPVPGGLSMGQFLHLIDAVVASGRKIIGADLVEVVPGENQWDANVGARVLYALSHRLS